MNKNKISTVEIGSTVQGLSDRYSDKDYMTLFTMSEEDLVFQSKRKHSYCDSNDGEHRYYSAQSFFKLITSGGSFDTLLLLVSQLSQASDTTFNQIALRLFKDDDVVKNYLQSIQKNVILSQCGNFHNTFKKFKTSQSISGKKLLNLIVCFSRAKYFYDLMTNYDTQFKGLSSIIIESTHYDGQAELFLPYKREDDLARLNNIVNTLTHKQNVDQYLSDMSKQIDQIFHEVKHWEQEEFNKHDLVKSDFVKFVVTDLLDTQ